MKRFLQHAASGLFGALQELRAHKLRAALSLLGISIGIFCIIAVLTAVDSMKSNVSARVETLGSDVLYVGKWPWTAEDNNEYKWWEYLGRRSMWQEELRAVAQKVPGSLAALSLTVNEFSVKFRDREISRVPVYAVTEGFDRIQHVGIHTGRYFSPSEINGGNGVVVLGYRLYEELFPSVEDPSGRTVFIGGRKFAVTGVMEKSGQNMGGYDFDNGLVLPFAAMLPMIDRRGAGYEPVLLVKAGAGMRVEDMRYEVEGALRAARKVAPGAPNDFSINQLSQIAEQLDMLFATLDLVGIVIAGFSLLVGAFGVANIMFVSVRERTRIIGLKMAIGASRTVIMREFLTEAVMLCLLGGMAGVAGVFLISLITSWWGMLEVSLSFKNFLIGISVSAVVGVLAGWIPARAAASMNPVAAIRFT